MDEAVGLLKRVTGQGLEPDMVTYNAMIKAAANARPARVEVAMDMLSRLSWQGLKPDQRLCGDVDVPSDPSIPHATLSSRPPPSLPCGGRNP